MLKAGQWARRYQECIECGTQNRPHYALGLCNRCYMRRYKRRQRKTMQERIQIQLKAETEESR